MKNLKNASRPVGSQAGQALTTPKGVSTNRVSSKTAWVQKQPSPGPRTGSSGAPLYSGRRGSGEVGGGSSITSRGGTACGAWGISTAADGTRGHVGSGPERP